MNKFKRTPVQIILDTLGGMHDMGGVLTNEEFYAEFNFRLKVALGLLSHKDEEINKKSQEWNYAVDAVAYCVKEIINNKPEPPKPRTVISYKAKYLRTKLKVSRGLLNLFNIKKKEKL